VIVSFLKSTLSFLGFASKEEEELNTELNSTRGDFEILPAAHRDTQDSQGHATSETGSGSKLYPILDNDEDLREKDTDLRIYLDSLTSRPVNKVHLADANCERKTPHCALYCFSIFAGTDRSRSFVSGRLLTHQEECRQANATKS
jgi:hypothetical protein